MEVKDVRDLQKELSLSFATMVMSFEAETGCRIDGIHVRRIPRDPYSIEVDVIVEI